MFYSILAWLAIFTSTSAYAVKLPTAIPAAHSLPATFTADYDFEGIVKLSNCSGSLIQLENAKDTDLGLVLTNGHCLEAGFLRPGAFLFKSQSSRTFTLLNREAQRAGTVRAQHILYGTMTKTDMAIYRLTETYEQIRAKYGIRPYKLSSQHPEQNAAVEVISGFWSRGYSCRIDRFVYSLKEASYLWNDSIRYTQPGCETIGGTSGSPLVLKGSKIVIGVNNTGNDDGEECTMNNPCEIDESGQVSFRRGHSYAQQTHWVYTCLNEAGDDMNLARPGCQLPH